MTVTPVNDAPVAVNDSLVLREDTTGRVNVLANDSDVDGDALSVSLLSGAAHGTASCSAAGVCTYTPAANFAGVTPSATPSATAGAGRCPRQSDSQ